MSDERGGSWWKLGKSFGFEGAAKFDWTREEGPCEQRLGSGSERGRPARFDGGKQLCWELKVQYAGRGCSVPY